MYQERSDFILIMYCIWYVVTEDRYETSYTAKMKGYSTMNNGTILMNNGTIFLKT